MIEFIVEVIVGLIFNYPGGYVRWIIAGKKGALSEFVNQRIKLNILISSIVFGVIILLGLFIENLYD